LIHNTISSPLYSILYIFLFRLKDKKIHTRGQEEKMIEIGKDTTMANRYGLTKTNKAILPFVAEKSCFMRFVCIILLLFAQN